jgi:hypothetical protein
MVLRNVINAGPTLQISKLIYSQCHPDKTTHFFVSNAKRDDCDVMIANFTKTNIPKGIPMCLSVCESQKSSGKRERERERDKLEILADG